ncbi:carnitine 3-dehydrogenase [Paroceanicella profunda]|uniref:carnitine 3-dehydrogenase n=1 Tax=Paroceanicella profunda TaxID=2579971 RepID=UPI003D2B2C1E
MLSEVAVIGAGVIGAGWVARLVENGVNVSLYDPDPETPRKLGEILANADHAYGRLTLAPRPKKGKVHHAATVAEAVAGKPFIVEAVPERMDLKRRIYAEIEAANTTATIASSTSGILPTDLQAEMAHPGRLIVAHPFNPVYLLPLVEIVGGARTEPGVIAAACAFYERLGMKPLHIRKEIPAFIADRLLEAVWREGLWLINDEICTTEELDDAIRYGFGLRWAQMGLFETYRIAGGEAGMKHFIEQFGPCLAWPWTKLTDVPELTPELVNRIAEQSDAQSGAYPVRALERIRDDNLVAILQALKAQDWGAGRILAEHEKRLFDLGAQTGDPDPDTSRPIRTFTGRVAADWTDYNGHMNEARYLQVFADATDAFLRLIGVDAAYVQAGGSYFTVESHLRHLDEVRAGEPVRVETRVLEGKGKKLRLFHQFRHGDGHLLATGEHMLLHVNLGTRSASEPGSHVAELLGRIAAQHAELPVPEGVGRAVGQPR